MRLPLLTIITLSFIGQAIGQEISITNKKDKKEIETLFSKAKPVGAYLSTGVKATELAGRPGVLIGSELAMVLGHKFNFGITGYGMTTDIRSEAISPDGNSYYLTMGYGGLFFEPVVASHKMIHVTFPITVGMGGLGLNEHRLISYDNDWTYSTYGVDYDFFLMAETGMTIELNVFKILRLDIGASYRFVGDVELMGTNNSDIQGLSTNITLKVGAF